MKEKARREGKQGDSLGGVLLSDNDKSLLQRWTMMMDCRSERTPTPDSDGATKNKDSNVNSQGGVAISDNTPGALNHTTGKEARSHEQLVPEVEPNQQGVFPPPSTQQPPLLFPVSQRKPAADVVAAVSGGMDMLAVPRGFVENNTLKPQSESNGGFHCLGNWNRAETRPAQPGGKPQAPPPPSFLQPHHQAQGQNQPNPQPQSHLLPLESFLTKAPALTARETNGNVGRRNSPHHDPSAAPPPPCSMEKLCPSVGEQSGAQAVHPLCGSLGVPSQPHPSLGFTDTGQQGPPTAPDIHTVTLQLSKSQVCSPCSIAFCRQHVT